jgi:uncharacterized protein (TIGR00255 family)
MTGYGSAKGTVAGFAITIELRSVNNRYLDLGIKLPRGFLFAESEIKNYIQKKVSRGKLDFFLTLDSAESDQTRIRVNTRLAEAYRNAITGIGETLELPAPVSALDIARFPDVLSLEKEELDQGAFLEQLFPLLDTALDDFNAMRTREGEKLAEDLLQKADHIEELVLAVERQAPKTVSAYRERLEAKLREVLADTSAAEERVIAEAAIFADRVATDEETVRLHSHLSQFRKLMEEGSPIGRKLDFLIQEFNREANTIGSKCQDSEIAYLVVELKSEIEKIREQVQNIE